MYLNKLKLQKQLKKFKNRKKQKLIFNDSIFSLCSKYRLYNNSVCIYVKNLILIELKIYRFFFLKLRKLSKKKKFKLFVLISCNHCFSKKSKNSRMGKGKGKFLRYVFRYKLLRPIFIFYKISLNRVSKFLNFLNKKNLNLFFF